MRPQYNLWIEQEGQVVLSQWRVRLLEMIDETGSISAAAEALGLPYRRAWEKVQEIEAQLGAKMLATAVGGAHGGGAKLTPAARRLIQRFHAFADGLDDEINRRYQAAFGRASGSKRARVSDAGARHN